MAHSPRDTLCILQNDTRTPQCQVFGFVGTDQLRTKIIINNETLEQVKQFTYLACNVSYQFCNDVEF